MRCAWRREGPPTGVCSVLHLPLWDPHSVGTPQLGKWLLTLPPHDCSTAETGQRAGPGSRIPSPPHARPVPLLQGPGGDGRDGPLHPTPLPRSRARALSDSQINGHWERERNRVWIETPTLKEMYKKKKKKSEKLFFEIHKFRKQTLLLFKCSFKIYHVIIFITIVYYYYLFVFFLC